MIFLFFLMFQCVYCVNNITTNDINKSNNINLPKETSKIDENKTTTIMLVSEGGSISTEAPFTSLLKESQTVLLSPNIEMGKGKDRPSVARKGVDFLLRDNITHTVPNNEITSAVTVNKTDEVNQNYTVLNSTGKVGHKITTITDFPVNKTTINNEKPKPTPTINNTTDTPVLVKKPTVLSFEGLANSNQHDTNILPSNPSLDPEVQDQLHPPHIYNNKINNLSSHPGIVMPLVITILVVPVFAVLGYMALRRGHEAWKNRHYKRMDFLLDGMYNE